MAGINQRATVCQHLSDRLRVLRRKQESHLRQAMK
jgi:hypothetical protein